MLTLSPSMKRDFSVCVCECVCVRAPVRDTYRAELGVVLTATVGDRSAQRPHVVTATCNIHGDREVRGLGPHTKADAPWIQSRDSLPDVIKDSGVKQ